MLSGPLTIPHVFNGKNRFFFMVNDEWYSSISTGSGGATFPTAAIEGGDFSGFYRDGTTKAIIPIYDPATGNADGTGRTQFDYNGVLNKMDPARIDPISTKFVTLFYGAAPTGSDITRTDYRYPTSNKDTHDGFNVRGDFYQSARSQFAFRFSNGLETNPDTGFPGAGGTVGSKIVTNYYQYMGSHTWTISPTVVNVATFGWTNFYNSKGLYSQGTDNAVAKLGIPGLNPGLPATWGIPSVGFSDNFSGIGDSSDGPYVTTDPDISFSDNLSMVHGKHSFDFGFDFDRETFNELGNQFSRGSFPFEANATALVTSPGVLAPDTGDGFADFLLGLPYAPAYAAQIAQADYKRNQEGVYVDDNYKLTPKLSVQLGVRYELVPPWYNTLGQEFIVDLETNNSPLYPSVYSAATGSVQPQNLWPVYMRQGNCLDPYHGVNVRWVESDRKTPVNPAPQCANGNFPNSLMATDYTNWAPRIGISYSPTPTWVIRSGFGMYYSHDIANTRFDMARNLAGRVTLQTGGGTPGLYNLTWENTVKGGGIALIPPPTPSPRSSRTGPHSARSGCSTFRSRWAPTGLSRPDTWARKAAT